jgi:hypothetical protein
MYIAVRVVITIVRQVDTQPYRKPVIVITYNNI